MYLEGVSNKKKKKTFVMKLRMAYVVVTVLFF